MLGNNANSLGNKLESLKNNISYFGPSVITIQETKFKTKGSVSLPGYKVFDEPRVGRDGGGLLTAVDVNLDPIIVPSDHEDAEILTVQLSLGSTQIRVINAYGPQEDENSNKLFTFWQKLEQEIILAKDNFCLVLLELDANAKVGFEVLDQDLHSTSGNGKTLLEMIMRQNLYIANTFDQCQGVITRQRHTVNGIEKSVLDYVIICDKLKDFFNTMIIDEARTHVLTRFTVKNGIKKNRFVQIIT